jgi:hypothetical protein
MNVNSCYELYAILKFIENLDVPGTTAVRKAWRQAATEFGGEADEQDLILKLSLLASDVRSTLISDIHILDDRRGMYLSKIKNISKIWSPVGGNITSIDQLKELIRSCSISDLIMIDDLLKSHGSIIGDVPFDVNEVRKNAAEFAGRIAKSDVEPEVKAVALVALRTIIGAIDDFDISGATGVVNAISRAKAEVSRQERALKTAGGDNLGLDINTFIVGLYEKVSAGAHGIGITSAYLQTGPALLGWSG